MTYTPPWRKPRLDRPIPMAWADDERNCRKCKTPTHWRTQRGAAIHPTCEMTPWERLTPDADLDVLYAFVRALGAAILIEPEPEAAEVVILLGPCAWCGQAGVPITEDENYHCRRHLFPDRDRWGRAVRVYRWPPPQGVTA